MKLRTVAATCTLVLMGASRIDAQVTPPAPAADSTSALRVYIDCQFSCDMNLIRTEMTWVDYMNDRADAQVHVLVTEQGTGGGGSQYTLNFIGLKQFATLNDTLTYTATS